MKADDFKKYAQEAAKSDDVKNLMKEAKESYKSGTK
jgi:hypothetical protein